MNSTFSPSQQLKEWMRNIRRTLHQYPELGFEEFRTAQLIAEKLDELAIPYRTEVARTGVLATLGPEDGAGTIALRADMDGLPVEEKTGLPFASKRSGLMHACGHDGHVAMLLGAAALLKEKKLPGRVLFLFQPAEEGEGGATSMIADGALEGVDAIFAGHLDRHFRVGEIGVEPGLICAYTDTF
ncbi:M20 family metallopeptidase, partial [Thermodesulfobacteriota bacterium]